MSEKGTSKETSKAKKRDFFISYNNADKKWALWIAQILERNGKSCYIQEWDFLPGNNFVVEMNDASVNSERFIAVLSPNYLSSKYCSSESSSAFNKDPKGKDRSLIPIMVSEVEREGIFAAIIPINLVNVIEEKEAEKRLLQGTGITPIDRSGSGFPGAVSTKVPYPGSLRINNLPFIRNHCFIGRDAIFKNIRDSFKSGHPISLTQAIIGMGGLGKTQTALEYTYRYANKYNLMWWVPSETETEVLTAYKQFAVKMNLLDDHQQDHNIIIETVFNWMNTNSKWLFIYDNVEKISINTPWWPKDIPEDCNILITTRNRIGHIGQIRKIDISVFKEEEAISFLEKRTAIDNHTKDAKALSQRLDRLPLALEHAAAYIIANEISFDKYLSLLDQGGLKVLEKIDNESSYSRPITATLELSINKIKKIKEESALQLLYLCAYMDSENIEESLFSENAELLPSPLREKLQDPVDSLEPWKQLTQYSLLKKQEDGKGYSMHRLLQEVVRNKIEDDLWATCCLAIFRKTYEFTYGDIESHKGFLQLTPHVETFSNIADMILTSDEDKEVIALLYYIGGFGFNNLGYYDRALEWNHKALVIHEKVLGTDHPDTARTYNNIGLVYNIQKDHAKALEWYHKALVIHEKVLGTDPINTAITYNNIGLVHDNQKDYTKALEWLQKALAIHEKELGTDHPNTANIYNNIGLVYAEQEDYVKALEWHHKALDIREKVLGTDHPDTANTYNNIGLVYANQKDYLTALEWFQKALNIAEKVLGKDHPYTIRTQNNIASVMAEMSSS